jgi:hypothetical protein
MTESGEVKPSARVRFRKDPGAIIEFAPFHFTRRREKSLVTENKDTNLLYTAGSALIGSGGFPEFVFMDCNIARKSLAADERDFFLLYTI